MDSENELLSCHNHYQNICTSHMALFVFHKETKPIKFTMTIIRLIVMEAYKNFNAMDFYKKYVNRKYAIK